VILLLSSPKRWLKLLSVPVLATDLDLSHTVFLQEAFLAIYLRYSSHTGQNTAKTNVQGTLAAKWEIEMWWQPLFFDSATPTSYSTPIHYGVYLAPSPSYHPGILTTLIKIYLSYQVRFYKSSETPKGHMCLKFPKSVDRNFRNSRPKCKLTKSHISPQTGGNRPQTKTIFVRVPKPLMQWSVEGSRPPKGVNSKKCHASKNFEPYFLQNKYSRFLSISEVKGDPVSIV